MADLYEIKGSQRCGGIPHRWQKDGRVLPIGGEVQGPEAEGVVLRLHPGEHQNSAQRASGEAVQSLASAGRESLAGSDQRLAAGGDDRQHCQQSPGKRSGEPVSEENRFPARLPRCLQKVDDESH